MPRSPLLALGPASALLLVVACEMPRPQGAYTPALEAQPDAGKNDGKPIDDDEIPILDGTGGSDGNPGDGSQGDGGVGGDGMGEPTIEDKLSGDYWLRLDFYTRATTQAGTILTHTTNFAQARVGTDPSDGKFKMIDWQCVVTNAQTCESSCSSARTDVSESAGRAFRPSIRTLTINDDGSWKASEVPYAIGWEGDFNADPNAVMPTTESDPRVTNPDGGDPGIDIEVQVRGTILGTVSCSLNVVQKLAYSYTGTLAGEAFERGTVLPNDGATSQNVLGATCDTDTVNGSQSQAYTIRFVRAPRPIDTENDWKCPSGSEFRSALPNP